LEAEKEKGTVFERGWEAAQKRNPRQGGKGIGNATYKKKIVDAKKGALNASGCC